MSSEAVLEVAIYMHRFHNLDLFQQGWYQIKVTSQWEGFQNMHGVPARVVQYEALDGIDDTSAIWQINDADHSFCTRPFRIKYARQDVFLAVMISFNLFLKAVEFLFSNAVIIKFELLFAPVDVVMYSKESFLNYRTCASHEFRLPSKALLGLHAYCPLHFDTWHMVLIDITVHSVLLKMNSGSLVMGRIITENGNNHHEATARHEVKWNSEVDATEITLWKVLYTSREILKHEVNLLGSAIQQNVQVATLESKSVTVLAKKLNLSFIEDGAKRHRKGQNWSQDIIDSLQVHQIRFVVTIAKTELLEAFLALGNELSALWNTFLQLHTSNRMQHCEYLRNVWVDERSTEWSLWLMHSKMEIPSISESVSEQGPGMAFQNFQFSNDPTLKRTLEDASTLSSSRAELHRKTLGQTKMSNYALQDMQIYSNPTHLPIVFSESHTVPAGPALEVASKIQVSDKHLLENSLRATTSKSAGRVLRMVAFVHGFQGHHLDLRLVRNQWLLIDPNAECLMSEINEDRTTSDFRELGHRLAEEVVAFMKTKFGSFLRKTSGGSCRLSFVGHSMGNIIIRTAIADPLMKPYLQYLHTFLSISGPHLGYLYNSNTLFNSGLWLLKKLKASPCMHQLTFTDQANVRDCFLFKLSEERTFEYFQNVVLLSSPQDRYVPYHSARVEMCEAALHDSRKGPAYTTMHQNCMEQILRPSVDDRTFMRCDVNFNTSMQARTLNNLIGRTAHIEFLETHSFLRFIMWMFPKLFS